MLAAITDPVRKDQSTFRNPANGSFAPLRVITLATMNALHTVTRARSTSSWSGLVGLVGLIACSSTLESRGDDADEANQRPALGDLLGDGTSSELAQGASGGEGDFAACAGQTAGAEVAPSVLQLVVDTSGSMDQDAPGPTRGSKWEATRRALLAAIDEMAPATAVGVLFYPDLSSGPNANNDNEDDVDGGQCVDGEVDVALQPLGNDGSQQRQSIRRAFQNQNPRGGTPTHDAYRLGVQQLQASTLPGPRFVVVITDGVPTFSLGCSIAGRSGQDNAVDSSPLVPEAAGSLTLGAKTFVIGSPGSEGARESLSRMAEAGGTATVGCSHTGPSYCHFDMTDAQDFAAALAAALGQIAGLALGCSYEIPVPPNGGELDPSKVNVLFRPAGGEPEVIAQSSGQTCVDGWQYSADQTQVLLCGDACTRVRDANGSLTLEFGCATRIR
jgi:hypothetical protein